MNISEDGIPVVFWLDGWNALRFLVTTARVRAGIFVPVLVNRTCSAQLICPTIN